MSEAGSLQQASGSRSARMREFFVRYGLHASVVLVCLASSVMLWTALLVHLNTERVRIIESQRQENDNLAKVFEEHVARTIRAAEVMLREVASEYRRHGKAFDLARYAEDRRVYLDPYAALSIVDAKAMFSAASSFCASMTSATSEPVAMITARAVVPLAASDNT